MYSTEMFTQSFWAGRLENGQNSNRRRVDIIGLFETHEAGRDGRDGRGEGGEYVLSTLEYETSVCSSLALHLGVVVWLYLSALFSLFTNWCEPLLRVESESCWCGRARAVSFFDTSKITIAARTTTPAGSQGTLLRRFPSGRQVEEGYSWPALYQQLSAFHNIFWASTYTCIYCIRLPAGRAEALVCDQNGCSSKN
jgi:hypothetical protein